MQRERLVINPVVDSRFGENSFEGEISGERKSLEVHTTAEFGTTLDDEYSTLWAIMHPTDCQVCREGLVALL